MYIFYWTSATGNGSAYIVASETAYPWNSTLTRPSDCFWIVPGTVGVDD